MSKSLVTQMAVTPAWATRLADVAVPIEGGHDIGAADRLAADAPLRALVETQQEMTAACAAAFRVIAQHKLADYLEYELLHAGVKDGFGVRAAAALRDFEGGKENNNA